MRNVIACGVVVVTLMASRATTFYCDPKLGDVAGDGSANHPWRTIQEAIETGKIELRDQQGKRATTNSVVKAGDTILLRSGWHGVLRINGGYNEMPITISAAPESAPAVGFVEIGEGSNWILDGLIVSPSLAPSPLDRTPRYLVTLGERGGELSTNLVVQNCFVYSVLDSSGWNGKDWVDKPANGIWLGRHGRRHIARNNYVLNTRFGIELCAPECVAEGMSSRIFPAMECVSHAMVRLRNTT